MESGLLCDIDWVFAHRFEKENPRVQELLAHLMAMSRSGHLCLRAEGIGEIDLQGMPVVRRGDTFYLERLYFFERRLESSFLKLRDTPPRLHITPNLDPSLTDEQRAAVEKGLKSSLFFLSGGPGRGKTFTAQQIIKGFAAKGAKISMAAPTGKAAARLGGTTLHSLLGIKRTSDLLGHPPLLGSDLIVVDECSMIDAGLFSYLLAAVKPGSRLILMGDRDQLPPVEAGSVFAELAAHAPYAELKKCMRSDRKDILDLAESVNRGDASLISKVIEPLPAYPEKITHLADTYRILTTMRQGMWGALELNRRILKRKLNALTYPVKAEFPIMITRSSFDQNLFNGETGTLVREMKTPDDPLGTSDYALFGERRIPALLLPAFEYAYAISVHKSQGSEFDNVLLIIPPGSERFGREVLYTGLTRAKEKLKIMGEGVEHVVARGAKKYSEIFGPSARPNVEPLL